MKNKFPKSLSELSIDENAMFHLSSQIDYNVQCILAKLKHIASLSPTLAQMQTMDQFINNLIKTINDHYEEITKEATH